MRPITTLTAFHWSLVTKNLQGHEMLRKQIHEKIGKLEKHLKHFPPDTVHLQIALARAAVETPTTARTVASLEDGRLYCRTDGRRCRPANP